MGLGTVPMSAPQPDRIWKLRPAQSLHKCAHPVHLGHLSTHSYAMGKGKNRAPVQEEDTFSDVDADAGQFNCTQALEELTSSITRRYTITELQHSLLYLTRRNQGM